MPIVLFWHMTVFYNFEVWFVFLTQLSVPLTYYSVLQYNMIRETSNY